MKRLPGHTAAVLLLFTMFPFACNAPEAVTESTATVTASPAPAPSPPSSDQARTIIADSAEWSDFQSPYSAWSLPTSKSMLGGAALQGARDLEKAGWISLRSGDAVLTEKARGDRRFLERPNGSIDIVPLAKKEITTADTIRPGPEHQLLVDVQWQWIPNDVGQAFRSGAIRDRLTGTYQATVTLQPAERGGWEVLRIVPR
ncbi:MAG: hypothetical protein ABI718_07520 [Acidobacteriota bacterium]